MSGIITGPGDTPVAGQGGGPQASMNINPSSLEDVTCDKCGNYTFEQVTLMKRMPAIISPTGKEAFVPMQVYACVACNNVNDRFIDGMGGWFKGSKGGEAEIREVDESVIEGSELPGLELVSPTEESDEE